jgi:D-lactate dehydrogenase
MSDGLVSDLEGTGVEVGVRATDRLAAAHDASHYLLTPRAVVRPDSVDQVTATLAVARRHGVPVTFRSGGTSLSGQAGTEGVLVDTRRHFRRIEVLDGGGRVRVQPGATVRAVNARLARLGRKLGPDPASEIACTIGGVVANNSSGMACGIEQNTYRTLDSAVLVLPSGTVIDTSRPDADERLAAAEPAIHRGLAELRDRVRGDEESVARLRELHSIKNTMGYGLNSFLDHDRPIDILEHLVVGSEGTLAWLAEATFRTVPMGGRLATALLIFPDLAAATSSLPVLVAAGFATIELLDAASLRVAQRDPDATDDLLALDVQQQAALLVEFQEQSERALAERVTAAADVLAGLPLVSSVELSSDPARRAALWHIRKGLYTLVAGARPSGTTALLEDIAVPVPNLYPTCTELIALFDRHGYEESVIFGHAKDGNIHFMLNERFDDPGSLARYEAFTEDMVELVLRQGGTLKAEHGTGRIMAPFVRRQYGDELYEVMRAVKRLIDPEGLLNPGVLLTDDPDAHVQHLKLAPTVEPEVDRCVECGYCEPVCPSKDLTLTPRQRIVLRREAERARLAGDLETVAELEREYRYDGVETCAVDGMCQTACPVLINTGDLVRRLRAEQQPRALDAGWAVAAGHWGAVSRLGGIALSVADRLPAGLTGVVTELGRAIVGADVLPQYSADLPAGGRARADITSTDPEAVYFSSCTTAMFGAAGDGGVGGTCDGAARDGAARDGDGVAESFLRLCARAGARVSTPDDLPSLCCGTPWKSKGMTTGYAAMKTRVAASLRHATRGGELPVVCDASSCTEGLRILLDAAEEHDIRVVDVVEFVAVTVLPNLPSVEPGRRLASITLHPTCSSTALGINGALGAVAAAVADEVVVPDDWGCCGFAGDRGMLHPELTAAATAPEAAQVREHPTTAHASLNRTCELGMTRATGMPYRHIVEVLDACVL